MNRRSALFRIASSIGGTYGLNGCGGGSVNSSQNVVNCPAGQFALGLAPAKPEMLAGISGISHRALTINSTAAQPLLPPYFNLSDNKFITSWGFMGDMLPAPGNQGQLGSCVAWGVGYAATSFQNSLANKKPTTSAANIASPQDLYSKTLLREAGNSCGGGTYIKDALDVVVDVGVASLAALPYSDANCSVTAKFSSFYLDGYSQIIVTDRMAIKAALSSFQVLPFGMSVYSDFMNLNGSQIYKISEVSASCASLGMHCMALVGYDDVRSAYRVMNSWTTTWGDGGYAWIDYDTFEKITNEIYFPQLVPSSTTNGLIFTAGAVSGPILAVLASCNIGLTGDHGYFYFKISDAMAANSYSISYVPKSGVPVLLKSASISQVLRGGGFDFPFNSGVTIACGDVFILNISGVSRSGGAVNLSISSKPIARGRVFC